MSEVESGWLVLKVMMMMKVVTLQELGGENEKQRGADEAHHKGDSKISSGASENEEHENAAPNSRGEKCEKSS